MRQLRIVKQITNRETSSLDKYLQEIGRVSRISVEEEVELARRIRGGDEVALEMLTKANLRFVVSVAKQYQNYGMSLGDLINEGNVGLMKAAHRYDETRGFKFISYAVWWIRQSIMRGLAENSRVVRLPLNRVAALSKMLRTVSLLEQVHQRDPTLHEIAQALDMSEIDVADSQNHSRRSLSVDGPIREGEDGTLLDTLEDRSFDRPDAMLIGDSITTDVKRVLNTLPAMEANVLTLYFGLEGEIPMSLDELGIRLNLTGERVRQIKEKATRKLRREGRLQVLRTYL